MTHCSLPAAVAERLREQVEAMPPLTSEQAATAARLLKPHLSKARKSA